MAFRQTTYFLEFTSIRLEPDERPEDLFQRLTAFIDNSLLTNDTHIRHHGDLTREDCEGMEEH